MAPKGKALDKWLEGDWWRRLPAPDSARGHTEFVAREAWHAATKHTLAFVAEEYRRRGDDDTAEFVMKLEP